MDGAILTLRCTARSETPCAVHAQSEGEETDGEGGEGPAAAAPPPRARAVRGAAAARKNYVIELSDSEDESDGSEFGGESD